MWNVNWADTPTRQKQLWFSVILNSAAPGDLCADSVAMAWPAQSGGVTSNLELSLAGYF